MEKRGSTPKSNKKVVSTPKSVKKSVSTPKSSAKKIVKKYSEKEDIKHVVNFSSDDESDTIQDVERLVNFRPMLEDIPEEDAEVHAMLGKYAKTSQLIGSRVLDAQNFGFQTPKKANSMLERTAQILQNSSASKCASPIPARLLTPSRKSVGQKILNGSSSGTTPVKGRTSTTVTPVKGRASLNGTPAKYPATPLSVKNGLNTPLRKITLAGDGPPTPAASRQALKRNLSKLKHQEEEESSEDDDSADSDESSEDSESEQETPAPDLPTKRGKGSNKTPTQTPGKENAPIKITISTVGRKKFAIKENPESYFSAHGDGGKIVTSDKTLSQLKTPRLSQEALRHMLSGEKMRFQKEIDQLNEEYHKSFHKWMLLLEENFNLLLYGLGSKRQLLHDFHLKQLSHENVVVVNGFFPSLTLKQILNSITYDLLDTEETFSTPSEQVDYICKNLEDSLFMIVHNLDGPMLRGDKNQSLLAKLGDHPKIHMIASIDHINATLMWDQQKLSHFNFVWYDVTSFMPYTEETLNENSLMVKQSGTLALNSLTRVFASLTPNAKGIYLIIVKYQMEGVTESEAQFYAGISFKDLYRMCRKAFLVNADLTLRAQLTEFRDHKLIRSRTGADGIEYLTIPLDNSTLQEFLDQQNLAEKN